MKKILHILKTRLPAGGQGFTIFFAMLVAALSLSVGLAIYDLTAREIDLSSTATQSQYALYVADTGAECALYWDANYVWNAQRTDSAFGTSSASTWAPSAVSCNTVDVTTKPPPSQDISRYPECTGNTGSTWCYSGDASSATTTFSINPTSGQPCVVVQITRRTITGILYTTVTSRGYNTCVSGAPLRVERTLQINY